MHTIYSLYRLYIQYIATVDLAHYFREVIDLDQLMLQCVDYPDLFGGGSFHLLSSVGVGEMRVCKAVNQNPSC